MALRCCLTLWTLAIGSGGLLSCSSGPPRHETRRFPLLTYPGDISVVRATCREALRANGFPVRDSTETRLSSGEVAANGFTWTMTVTLGGGGDYASVDPTLQIDRNRQIRPVRRVLGNTGEMLDEADARRRDRFGGEPGRASSRSPEDIREQAIRDLTDRVYEFIRDLEARMDDTGTP